ncbi:MAG: hypothetical protein IPL53_04270 [Ignavibacteria bacterium]|nr:hypothetical protein [Ignavibacteria bacterium]
MKLTKYIVLFYLLIILPVNAQHQLKIMTYNLLNYSSTDTAVRNPHFRTIINAVNPDILVVCEITSQNAVNSFLSNVMNSGGAVYSAGTFINGFDTDNAIFYKSSKINFISNTPILTSVRNINEFKVSDKNYNDTLRIYSVHLKANASDSSVRSGEVDSLRKRTNILPSGTDFIVLGDFNIYSSNETAYQKLIKDNVTDDGNFADPLNLTGIWNRSSYAPFHTQSTRTRAFGDGATGGLDDRFDMILYSKAVKNSGGIKFIPGTYTAYGNDGLHYNDSINQIPNSAVSQTIANALHYASDHLPVYAVFEFGNATILNVKVIPEGMYNSSLNRLSRKDSITVYLRNTFTPYSIADSAKSTIDSVSFNSASVFRKASSGNYFIAIKTINSIETWSKTGIQYTIENLLNYDFTSADSSAFGNNLTLEGTKYCVYSGDVNNDGFIDLDDVLSIFNDANIFSSGYTVTDLNG